MSHGEDMSLAAFWDSMPSADRKKREWLKGPMITYDDMNQGTGSMVKCTAREWFAMRQDSPTAIAGGGAGATSGATSGAPKRPWKQPNGATMGFGKYRERLLVDVREDDSRYFDWCCGEVPGFAARARKARLLDGAEEAA